LALKTGDAEQTRGTWLLAADCVSVILASQD